ncbi:GNAT family N-acetyltransferase [Granulicella sp. 5B5]|uniref:GNAT family N-acetyltransferase n=1 Tax=Granulicella sp. 5B5 TaxID=1617967 RepID=UPI0015F503B5|nr:GNAT family N-acetyltransferase [Granulicella sp. 5B5]
MPPTIRRATPDDLTSVLALLTLYYNEWQIQQRDDEPTVAAKLQHAPLGYFLAFIDNEPAGCVMLRDLPNIPSAAEPSAECKRLYVAPAFRGHRLANLLMDAAESTARTAGYHWLYLDSAAEFTTAIALYRRRGYLEIPRFNDNPQATIFMRLALTA